MRWSIFIAFVTLSGCAAPTTYFDLAARTTVKDGVWSNLQTTDQQILMTWGGFGTSSIWVAYDGGFPDTIVAAWREGSIADHRRLLALRPLLPPLDPAKQKYHHQFGFYPGDSMDVKVDVLEIGDCSHIRGIGATRTPQHGPCSVMDDW